MTYFKFLFNIFSKAEFSASLLQSSVPHDPSEILLLIINVENIFAA